MNVFNLFIILSLPAPLSPSLNPTAAPDLYSPETL